MTANGQVAKYRTFATLLSVKSNSGEWSEWIKMDGGNGILIVRDYAKNKISTYGEKELTLSIISTQDMPPKEQFNCYYFECVDGDNVKCDVSLCYAKDTTQTRSMLLVMYPKKRLQFIIEQE